VSGSDADAGSSRSQSADMRPQVQLRNWGQLEYVR
jgi:hypothetical protein